MIHCHGLITRVLEQSLVVNIKCEADRRPQYLIHERCCCIQAIRFADGELQLACFLPVARLGQDPADRRTQDICRNRFPPNNNSRAGVGDSSSNARLIVGDRDCDHGDALRQAFKDGVQAGMSDAERGAIEQLQLRRVRHNNGGGRHRSDVGRPQVSTN